MTLAKSTAEVLKTTFDGDNQMIYVLTYVILGGMFCTIFLEQHWLASGLVHFDALYIVPVFQAFFIGVSVLGGAVYFQELSNFSLLQGIMFPFGVVVRALTPVVEAMVSPSLDGSALTYGGGGVGGVVVVTVVCVSVGGSGGVSCPPFPRCACVACCSSPSAQWSRTTKPRPSSMPMPAPPALRPPCLSPQLAPRRRRPS